MMTSANNYKFEIKKFIENMPAHDKDSVLQETLELLFSPETKLKTENEKYDDRLTVLEMYIDDINEKFEEENVSN